MLINEYPSGFLCHYLSKQLGKKKKKRKEEEVEKSTYPVFKNRMVPGPGPRPTMKHFLYINCCEL